MNRGPALLSILLLSAIAACSTTSEQLRTDPGQHGTFHVDAPYGLVYAHFVRRASHCSQRGPNPYRFELNSHDTSGQSATVEIVSSSVMGRKVLLSADIAGVDTGTDVTYFVSSPAWIQSIRPVMQEWATDTGDDCGGIG
jgi:hypothetical protein